VSDETGRPIDIPTDRPETAAEVFGALQVAPRDALSALAAVKAPGQLAGDYTRFLRAFKTLRERANEMPQVPSIFRGRLLTPGDALSGELQRAWAHGLTRIATAARRTELAAAPLGLEECALFLSRSSDVAGRLASEFRVQADALSPP
jgi:hypothetical protein